MCILRINGTFGGDGRMKMHWKNGLLYLGMFAFCFLGGRFTAAKQAQAVGNLPQGGKLAIVIDDFGYDGVGTKEMLDLPIAFTAAVMPFSAHSAENGKAVIAAGKEVIIHMPMESLTGKKSWVGDKGIFCSMGDGEIQERVAEAFTILPDAVGLNNHMGSAVMEDARCLNAVMEVLKKENTFFLDSVTTAKSKGCETATAAGVPFLARRVFLDSTNDVGEVKKNLRKAAGIALAEGSAVAIGHVGPEGGLVTVQAIKELIPELEGLGIVFVTAGALIDN